MKLLRILAVTLVAISTFVTINLNVASAAGVYNISCKNQAYGQHLGAIYRQAAYVYNDSNFGTTGDVGDATGIDGSNATGPGQQYIIAGTEAYVGNDCLYAGAADTNGTAVVAADIARLAVNAIVGAVTNRIDMAYAAKDSGASATGLSFTTQSDGIAMSANKIVGGLSFWADYGTSDFENQQEFTNVRLDSMKYDGSASSYSVGMDKAFGNALIGLVVSSLDTDIVTTFNSGTYKQEVDTMGVYLAYRTNILQIDFGMGSGDSDITTTRRDLGNDLTINGKTTAQIAYGNARIAANFTRGRFTLMPSASYRTMSMDMKGFTDDRADDVLANISGAEGTSTLFDAGNATTEVEDDTIAARNVESTSTAVGLKLSANLGVIMPYLDLSYNTEDTTRAAYNTESGTDGNDSELASTNYQSSMRVGAGLNFIIGSHLTGGVRIGSVNGRNDWSEDYLSGSISLGF
jgi:hypothetical protein